MSKPNHLKILVIGDSSVGKKVFITKFAETFFRKDFGSTIGVRNYQMKLDSELLLQLWEVLDGVVSEKIILNYYKGAQGAIIFFDLSRIETFEFAKKKIIDIKECVAPNIPFMLIGNKADLIDINAIESEREVFRKFAKNEGGFYIETSLMKNENIKEAIKFLANQCIEFYYLTKNITP